MKRLIALVTALAMSFVLALPASAHEGSAPKITGASLKVWSGGQTEALAGGYTSLVQFDDSVKVRSLVTGLTPGNVYTVWALIFNNPDACVGQCDFADRLIPEVQASMIWGGIGGYADSQGRMRGDAWISEGVDGAPGQIAFGSGLSNPLGADFEFIVFDHGQPSPDPVVLRLQLTTNTGCHPDGYACGFIQYSLHG